MMSVRWLSLRMATPEHLQEVKRTYCIVDHLNRFLPGLLRVIPLADELNGPFRPKDPITDRCFSAKS